MVYFWLQCFLVFLLHFFKSQVSGGFGLFLRKFPTPRNQRTTNASSDLEKTGVYMPSGCGYQTFIHKRSCSTLRNLVFNTKTPPQRQRPLTPMWTAQVFSQRFGEATRSARQCTGEVSLEELRAEG